MPPRLLAAYAALSFLALSYVVLLKPFFDDIARGIPDITRYKSLRVMTKEEFPIDDSSRRVIIVGDIHGQFDHLLTLLKHLAYDNATDTLIHVGDVITRGSHHGSLDVLSYLSSNSISGVRGNHDQTVIEWRGWTKWIASLDGGKEFLQSARSEWEEAKRSGEKLEKWNQHQHQRASGKAHRHDSMDEATARWWRRVPEDWVLFSDAYMLARDMPERDFEYLLSLPLRIYIPHAHLFLVHAGMLSHDPRHDFDHPNQPLMHVSDTSRLYAAAYRLGDLNNVVSPMIGWLSKLALFRGERSEGGVQAYDAIAARREKQERAILGLALNKDPWVLLNLRGVKENGKPTRSNTKGTPWSAIWNEDMNMCGGFGDREGLFNDASVMTPHAFPCLPMSVIYGHAAARGLDIKRWTFGLDTGCVYGKRLTALVLGRINKFSNDSKILCDDDDKAFRAQELIPFGDVGHARLASVSCKA